MSRDPLEDQEYDFYNVPEIKSNSVSYPAWPSAGPPRYVPEPAAANHTSKQMLRGVWWAFRAIPYGVLLVALAVIGSLLFAAIRIDDWFDFSRRPLDKRH